MITWGRTLLLLVGVWGLAGCEMFHVEEEYLSCPEERSVFQACSMDYNPVCGIRKDGSSQTYSNPCGACGDEEVDDYRVGECDT